MGNSFDQDIADVNSIKAIPKILDIVCRMTGMRFAAVARVTEDRWVACSVHDEIEFGLKPGAELNIETTICHEIRQSGKAVVIDHVANDSDYKNHHTPELYGLQSYISMPIMLSDRSFFGTLCAVDPEPHRLKTPEIIGMFEMFAELIGFHLSAIDRLQSAEATLLAERKTSALREQFIAVLGHDLRNPLSGINSGMQVLQRSSLPEPAERIVKMVRGGINRMASLIDNIMDFARGRLGGGLVLDRNAADELELMLNQVIAELKTNSPGRVIESHISLNDSIYCDCQRLAQLVSNLLANALTYGDPHAPIRVRAATYNNYFELYVANAGKPITEETLKNIFHPFSRGTDQSSRQGLGLGLYISSEIAKAHGGILNVTSDSVETRFTFRMPLQAQAQKPESSLAA